MGLRRKILTLVGGIFILTLLTAILVFTWGFFGARDRFATQLVQDQVKLASDAILVRLAEKVAIARVFARSETVKRWAADESDAQARDLVLAEARRLVTEEDIAGVFVVHRDSGNYYYEGRTFEPSSEPRYRVSFDAPQDRWFRDFVDGSSAVYELNIDTDWVLGITNIWVNVAVEADSRRIAVAGAASAFGDFLQSESTSPQVPGLTPLILDAHRVVLSHPDAAIVRQNADSERLEDKIRFEDSYALEPDTISVLSDAMARVRADPGSTGVFPFRAELGDMVAAVKYLPAMDWYVVQVADVQQTAFVREDFIVRITLTIVACLCLFYLTLHLTMNRMLLRPIAALHREARKLEQGNFAVDIEGGKDDELGDLGRTFVRLAGEVKNHTENLEELVRSRSEELTAAELKLSQSKHSAAMGRMILSLAHEINTPIGNALTIVGTLRAIIGSLDESFRSQRITRSQFEDLIRRSSESSQVLESSISRVIRLVEAMRANTVAEGEDLSDFFLEPELARARVDFLAANEALSVNVELDVSPDLRIRSYPGEICQIVGQLLDNAARHGYPESGSLDIRIRTEVDAGQRGVSIIVEDNGVGMDSETLLHATEPFSHARMSSAGLGLGLYMISTLVQNLLHGDLDISSEAGRGTAVWVSIPNCLL